MKRPLLVLALQLALALSLDAGNLALLFPVALLPVLLLHPPAFRILLRWRLLAFLAAMVGAVPLVAGTRSATTLGVPYSPEYVSISLVMAARSLVILLGLRAFTGRISLSQLALAARSTRFRGFAEAFGLAMDLLPTLRDTTRVTYREYRRTLPRGGVIRHTLTWSAELMARVLVQAERSHPNRTGVR